MPIYEFICPNDTCIAVGQVEEAYFSRETDAMPSCEICETPMERIVSTFNAVGCHPLSYYNDPTKEGAKLDSHVMYRKRSSRSGKLEPVVIDSFQKQREFCKAEGLEVPGSVNPNATANADGSKLNTAGVKGQWV